MTSSAQVATIAIDGCPICGATERKILFEGHDHLHGLPGRFPVGRCVACGAAYLIERPADLADYYPTDSYGGYEGATGTRPSSLAPGQRHGLIRWRQLLGRLMPGGGYLLDVGCGTGMFLSLMQSAGWQVMGIEPNSEAARYARAIRGLAVRQGELPMPGLSAGEYDVITLRHVLEHVPDPVAVLTETQRLLKPNGVLIISLPVADSLEAKWFGAYWAGYDVPRHLVTFTRSSVISLGERLGFRVKEELGLVQGFASLRLSLHFWLADKGGLSERGRRFLTALLLPPLFVPLRVLSGHQLSVAVFVAHRQIG
jgi:SAM-dependent methyltransferase